MVIFVTTNRRFRGKIISLTLSFLRINARRIYKTLVCSYITNIDSEQCSVLRQARLVDSLEHELKMKKKHKNIKGTRKCWRQTTFFSEDPAVVVIILCILNTSLEKKKEKEKKPVPNLSASPLNDCCCRGNRRGRHSNRPVGINFQFYDQK